MSTSAPKAAPSESAQRRIGHVGDEGGAVIVFDGVCVLCNGWVGFLLKHDRRGRYRFAPMQGEVGRTLLAEHGLNPDDPLSFLLIEFDRSAHAAPPSAPRTARVSTDSTAAIRVVSGLGGLWRLFGGALAVPRALRDPLYRIVARNRYRWFGRRAACAVPGPEQASRFL